MTASSRSLGLFLAGDVMLGRGIDQILPHPSNPRIFEDYMASAEGYVRLAERLNGRIPRNAGLDYVWGDLLAEDIYRECDLRIINLETAITTADNPEPKGINYRMHPANTGVLTAASIDACTLANNHLIDWGRDGLVETLETLEAAKIEYTGAGRSARQAAEPTLLEAADFGRVLVLAFGSTTSGIPRHWAATAETAGINLLPQTIDAAVENVRQHIEPIRRPGDVLLVSIHSGGNWGFTVPSDHRKLAHALIESAGVDLIFGHSSHHPKSIEIHEGKLILYGCGDLINDYEGIGGHEEFRGDLAQAYFPSLNPSDGTLTGLEIRQYQRRKFRLNKSDEKSTDWLAEVLRGDFSKTRPEFVKTDYHTLRLA